MRYTPLTRALLASLVASLIAGCSHAGALPKAPATRSMGTATFIMHWPAKAAVSVRRGPKWISPSTQSVAVEINNDPTLTAIADNPSTGAPAVSSIAIGAPEGTDSITFSLFDAAGAKGNQLGQATITANIEAGKNNTVSATIDGIVASVDIAPLPNQPNVTAPRDASGAFTIAGDLPVTFAAAAKDADGNVILGPGDPIQYSAQSIDPSLSVNAVANQPNQFTIQVVHPPTSAGQQLPVLVKARDAVGGFAQTNRSVALAPLIYVAYQNSGAGAIGAMDAAGTAVPLPGAFSGLMIPVSMAYDGDDHRLYVVDGATQTLQAYNSDGTALDGYTAPSVPLATGVAYDYHNKDLYVSSSNNTVAVFDTAGNSIAEPGTFSSLNDPVAIALYDAGSAFYLAVANAGNNTYATYHEDGTPAAFGFVRRYVVSTGTLVPSGITSRPSGVIIVSGNDGTGDILQAHALAGGLGYGSQTAGLGGPIGLSFEPTSDAFVVANKTSANITLYNSDPSTSYNLLNTLASPANLTNPVSTAVAY